MANKIACNSCGMELLPAETRNTPMGNLCEGCHNLFLEFYKNFTKKQMIISIFIHLLPSLFFYAMYLTGNLNDFANEGMSFLALLAFIGGPGAYNIVKNGFAEVGDTVRKSYYKATFTSDTEVSISDHSYNGYTGTQWLTMLFNVVIFIIGVGLTLILGPVVFLVKLLKHQSAKNKYSKQFNPNLDMNKVTVSQSTLDSYTGLIAQKALDIDSEYTSIIEGVEVQHLGYLYYAGNLYAAIGTNEANVVFQEGIMYFLKLFPSNNRYEIVDVETDLYETLYTKMDS